MAVTINLLELKYVKNSNLSGFYTICGLCSINKNKNCNKKIYNCN